MSVRMKVHLSQLRKATATSFSCASCTNTVMFAKPVSNAGPCRCCGDVMLATTTGVVFASALP